MKSKLINALSVLAAIGVIGVPVIMVGGYFAALLGMLGTDSERAGFFFFLFNYMIIVALFGAIVSFIRGEIPEV